MKQNDACELVFATQGDVGHEEMAKKCFGNKLKFDIYDEQVPWSMSQKLDVIATMRAKAAHDVTGAPSFTLVSSFEIEALDGFPGKLADYVWEKIGHRKICALLDPDAESKRFILEQCIVFVDDQETPICFWNRYEGNVGATETLPIIYDQTFTLLGKFLDWYLVYQMATENANSKKMQVEWEETKEYLKKSNWCHEVSFTNWIMPLKLVSEDGETLVLQYEEMLPVSYLSDVSKYIQRKYGKIILASYNFCNRKKVKRVEIRG